MKDLKNNKKIVEILYAMAKILELKEVKWKPMALKRAGQAIDSLTEDIADIYKRDDIKGLKEIPGVGDRIAAKIIEFLKTGKVKEYERLKKSIPYGLDKLMEIQGIGPRRAKRLYKELNIRTFKDLRNAIEKHKIARLSGFGEESERDIKEALGLHKGKRYSIKEIMPIANRIIKELKNVKGVKGVEVAGSIRRKQESIGDVDLLAVAEDSKAIMDKFTSLKDVAMILAKGPSKSMVILKNKIQADIRVIPEKSFGAALQYFTGDKQHNIALRELARKKGLKLSEYGLFDRKTGKMIVSKREEDIYRALGLRWMKPKVRHNRGEIEKAKIK